MPSTTSPPSTGPSAKPPETLALFRRLDETRPEVAREVARLVRPTLIREKNYELAGKYVDPADIEQRIDSYDEEMAVASNPAFGEEMRTRVGQMYLEEVATSLALLVRTGRESEAESLAKRAKAGRTDAAFTKAVDQALKGEFPPAGR